LSNTPTVKNNPDSRPRQSGHEMVVTNLTANITLFGIWQQSSHETSNRCGNLIRTLHFHDTSSPISHTIYSTREVRHHGTKTSYPRVRQTFTSDTGVRSRSSHILLTFSLCTDPFVIVISSASRMEPSRRRSSNRHSLSERSPRPRRKS